MTPDARHFGAAADAQPILLGGRYMLREVLAVGGTATVTRATDQRLHRDVAIKRAPARDPQVEARLRSEAVLLARCAHPGIVACMALEADDLGAPYLVLELIDGPNLAQRAAAGPMPWQQALGWAIEVSLAVAHLDARGVVHGDLKPQHVVVAADGRAVLVDFDRAHEARIGEPPALATGIERFAAPEVRRGEPTRRESDRFSLGAVLRWLLLDAAAPGSGGHRRAAIEALIGALTDADPARRPPAHEVARQLAAHAERAGPSDGAVSLRRRRAWRLRRCPARPSGDIVGDTVGQVPPRHECRPRGRAGRIPRGETVARMVDQQYALLAILVIAFALLITEALRNDLIGLLVLLALWGSGLLSPEEALSGFSSEPAIVVVAIFVLTAALRETGVSEILGGWIRGLAGEGPVRVRAVLVSSVALLSAFTHHVAATGALLPVALDVARRRGEPPSRLLMPVSFGASLGTTITIIGAPAFLIASNALTAAGEPALGIFSITPIGLAITVLGTLFLVGPGRWLLPDRAGTADTGERFRLDSYLTEVTILPGSRLLGKSARDLAHDPRYLLQVVGRLREGRRVSADFGEGDLQEGDVLLVQASSDQLLAVTEEPGIELHAVTQYQTDTGGSSTASGVEEPDPAERLVQAVIAPNADIAGGTIGAIDFRRRFNVVVVGLWRKDSWLQEEIARIPLHAGDVLVLQGDDEALAALAAERAFLMLVPFQAERRVRRRAPIAAAIMVGAVVAAGLGVPLPMATLGGAALCVLTGCVSASQAYRSIDQRVFVFIAGVIPLGLAVEKSGASEAVAAWITARAEGLAIALVLLGLFFAVGIITQFMSDAATTAVFAPVGVALAHGLDHDPAAYVVTIAVAAVTSFITPLGHHGNLLVYGPGGYRFSDFMRVGTPLTIIVAIATVLLAPMLWPP